MIEALRTGLVGLVFNNSKLSGGTNIPFTIREIVKKLEQLPNLKDNKVLIKPVLKDNTVEYEIEYGSKDKIPDTNYCFFDKDFRLEFLPVIDALIKYKYKEEFKDLAKIDSLKEFGERIGDLLSEKGYWDKKQIVIHETSDLTVIAKNIQKELGEDKGIEIPGELLREYWKKAKKRDSDKESVNDLVEEIPSARNFAAYAALNHDIIEIIKLDENSEIIEIIYNGEKLYRILKEKTSKYTSLLKCIPRRTETKLRNHESNTK